MQKIVINKCFGGFSLSQQGEKAYLARKGKQAYFYKQTKYSFQDGVDEYERIDIGDNNYGFYFTLTKDFGAGVTDLFYAEGYDKDTFFDSHDLPRDDPDLVAVVEELGEAANGQHARLAIVEIPDGVQWTVEEYDGNEHVAEAHEVWY